MGKGGSRQTVGYRYYMGAHMTLCHGPVDRLLEIRVDDRTAWAGVSTGGPIEIVQPELFGGEKREGGVEGVVDVMMGGPEQGENAYLAGLSGGALPGYRGVLSVVLNQVYVGINPYLKPWSFRVQRVLTAADGAEQWHPEKAEIQIAQAPDAEVVHVDATVHGGSTREAAVANGVTVGGFKPSDQVWVTMPPGKRFSGWSPWSTPNIIPGNPQSGAKNAFYVGVDGDAGNIIAGGAEGELFDGYDAARRAFGGLMLTGGSSYRFGIVDQPLSDNSGGVSLLLGAPAGPDMNPAHIIRECLANREWGLGYADADIGASFAACADTLHDEKFGLSLAWQRSNTVEDFIQDILRHIDGNLYVDRRVGTWELNLVRGGYDVAELPEFDEGNVLDWGELGRRELAEAVNAVTVTYADYVAGVFEYTSTDLYGRVFSLAWDTSNTYDYTDPDGVMLNCTSGAGVSVGRNAGAYGQSPRVPVAGAPFWMDYLGTHIDQSATIQGQDFAFPVTPETGLRWRRFWLGHAGTRGTDLRLREIVVINAWTPTPEERAIVQAHMAAKAGVPLP